MNVATRFRSFLWIGLPVFAVVGVRRRVDSNDFAGIETRGKPTSAAKVGDRVGVGGRERAVRA